MRKSRMNPHARVTPLRQEKEGRIESAYIGPIAKAFLTQHILHADMRGHVDGDVYLLQERRLFAVVLFAVQ